MMQQPNLGGPPGGFGGPPGGFGGPRPLAPQGMMRPMGPPGGAFPGGQPAPLRPGGPPGPATAQLGGQMAGMSLGPPLKPMMMGGGGPQPMMGQQPRPAGQQQPLAGPPRPVGPAVMNGLGPQSNGHHPQGGPMGRISPLPPQPAVNGGGMMPPYSAPSPMPPGPQQHQQHPSMQMQQQQPGPMGLPPGPGQSMPPRPGGMPPLQPAGMQGGNFPPRGPAPAGANPPMVGGPMPPMMGSSMARPGGPMMPGGPMPPMPNMSGPMAPNLGGGPLMSQPAGAGMPPPMGGGMPPMQPMGGMMPGQQHGAQPGSYPSIGGMGGMPPQPGYQPSMTGQPGGMAPGYAGMAAPQRKSLDPDSMPNPIQVMEDDQRNCGGEFHTNEKGKVPPLVTTKFLTRDMGNSGPRFIRSTMYTIPDNPDTKKQTGVPFGLVLCPMAEVQPGEYPPPIVNLGELGPVRCVRCKAYMSPFMTFTDGGKRFQCSFCKATTDVPQEYFQHLDHTGQRMDKHERPELCLGTYEFVATKDYCRDSKPPNPPGILFAIDVSYPMVKEGIVQLICQNMKDILRDLPIDSAAGYTQSKMKVGFMTYDNKINFYNCNKALAQPQQMTVGDVQDMFVPLAEGLMVDLAESEAVIDSLLEQLPAMFAENRETETILGPVIQAGKEAFKAAGMAGKLVVFHHNLPVAEAPGKLKNRDDRKCLGTEKEKTVLTPQTKFYNDLGQECVSVGCSVDLFLFNNAYIDIATLSQVCRLTGGQVYKYTYFQADLDGERFISDLRHNVSRSVVFDGIMRVRTSTGVRPTDFFGAFFMANTTDMELASLNSDAALCCEVKHDDKLTDEDGVYIQAALLYTSVSGQRRLRVSNVALNISDNMGELYRNCDLDTVVNFLAKQSITKLIETNPKAVREGLMQQCAQILACYRKNCASPSSAGQLILPECMKLLPLYTNCLLKSDAIAGGADLGCDDRAYAMSAVSSMDVASSVVYFYPRLLPLHDVPVESDEMPTQIRCTIEKIRDDGVYLLENGLHMLLFVGLAANPAWIQDVFGVQTAAQIDIDRTTLVERDNALSRRICGILDTVTRDRPRTMKLTIVRQRDKLDIIFKHYLCEDRSTASDTNFSYVDFLCHMHKEIRAILS